ncbi:GEVED domain-containing protein [Flavobacterium litorale]|uniref:T9SS type A sorting domain-containing protein n=1 Tax=Flavobacterium litorale TaxID=2856519 RepID=A0ABX8VBL5_9FLAO|nr:GEVED domain-containing protein [Flavobacterium litorale]QYJ68049.1 T9SS type A sorting domain-containing protein [Flavobacterium litorale]
MKNTTFLRSASDYGKNSKRWLLSYLTLFTLLSITAVSAQGTIGIGSGSATSANRVPIYSCYNYTYSQQIIQASEFATSGGVAGDITKVSYFYNSGGTNLANWNEWTVYLGHTTKTEFSSTTDWEDLANLTEVYSGAITPVAGEWFEITFTVPFNYDGTSNLIIAIDENVPGYSCTANFGSYSGNSNTGLFYFSDGTNPDPAAPPTGTLTSTLARIEFEGAVASCLAPSGLAVTTMGTNDADIAWDAVAAATDGYEYYHSTSNTTPVEATVATGTAASGDVSANIAGLTSNTTYYVWIRSNCGAGSVSSWSASTSFTTLCDATDVPYMQDVESATTPGVPACIITENAGLGNNWTTVTNPGYGFTDTTFRYQYNSSNAANAWFYLQGLNLTAGTSYRLSYTYGNDFTFYTEKLRVSYGTSAGAAAMLTELADHPDISSASPTTTFVDFTPTTTGVYYIGFNAYSAANQNRLFVDDISVTLTPTCEPVTGVVATTTSFTSGNVVWNESTDLPANGYEYYISTDATEPTGATIATGDVAAGVLTADLTGLTQDTEYYVWVRSACSDTDLSPWAGPSSFVTSYCTPAPTSVDNDGIINVDMGTISNATDAEAGNYADYSAQSTDAFVGATVDFAITYGTGYTYGTKIWIDWNDDTDFDDDGELVYTGLSESDNPTILTGSFAIPADAGLVGSHRVRIGGTDNNSGGTPCYTGSYGSYEDYSINIVMPPAPVITEFTPASYCAADGDITITGTGLGNATLEIGGEAITIDTNTDTEIVANVAAGISGTVAVTTVGGTDTTTDVFEVTTPATLTLSGTETTICDGNDTELVTITAGAADFDVYEWSPSDSVTGNATDGYTFSPSETTTFTLTASQSAGSCVVMVDYIVNVNPVPDPVTVTPETTDACFGEAIALMAEGGTSIIPIDYCVPTVGNTGASGDYIGSFSFADIENNDSGDAVTDYTYYSDLTANVEAGETYDLTVDAGGIFGQGFRIWIDYNMDGEFTTDESVYDSGSSGTDEFTGSVTISTTAFNGLTRMRVGCRYNAVPADADACGHTGYGEWEDYNVMVTGGQNAVDYVWSPIEGLYEDAEATIPYTGTGMQTVYAMPMATVTYTATVTTDLGCPASDTATLNITFTPAPTGDAEANFTTAATVADLVAMGTDIQWYNVATGGTALAATDDLSSGMYYATQTLDGCESGNRLAVMVTIPEMDWVNLQWPPMMEIVEGTTGTAYAQGYEPGVTPGAGPGIGVSAWIAVSTEDTDPSTWTNWVPMAFNTQVGNNDEFMAEIGEGLEPGTYYYASRFQYLQGPYSYGGYSADGGSFWDGVDYVSGMLTVTCGTMAPMADANQAVCDAGTIADLVVMGENIQWYDAEVDGAMLADTDALVDGMTYYASQTIDCESLTRTAVTVTINVTAAPMGDAEQTFEDGATVADLMAMGENIQWYDAEVDGAMLAATDMLVDGMMYYASQTMNDCESQDRLAVMATVNAPAIDYVNLQYPGEVTVSIAQSAMIYVQAYEAGVTEGTGPGFGVTAWIGVSTENTDPSTWDTWIPTTFNIQSGNNDEYVAEIGANLEPGTYYYASRVQLHEGSYMYGGYNEQGGNTWDGVMYVNGVLNVLCDTPAPDGATEQIVAYAGDAPVIANLDVTGTDVVWYPTAQDAIDGTNPLTSESVVEEGSTYYATQTINGCTGVVSLAVTVTGLLSDGIFDINSFNYYPNPVKDVLTIQHSSDITSVSVFNMLGQQVMVKQPNTTDAKLDMSALSDGTYIVTINADKTVKTIKVVKKQ